jgi:hypothetical protein
MSEQKTKKRVKNRLPKRMLLIKSSDKGFHERWYKGRNPMNFCHPTRLVCAAKPNAGKTNYVKNWILRAKPAFDRIFVLSCDPNASEYNDVQAEVLTEIPPPEYWIEDSDEKKLIILDDCDFTGLDKQQKVNLSRLVGFCSTHCNLSVAICNQNFFDICGIARKCCSVWAIWRPSCNEELNTISRRCGVKAKDIQWIFDNLCTEYTDSLTIDMSVPAEYKLKKNGFEIIKKKKKPKVNERDIFL